ncbi:beta-N-acetylhexosaminidase [Balneolaceae bacterium YR4-1]|uniref:beta-N-acetylhexosaminidase n=1 Tax=Halalkalibaculum roseum TaxID=2709311 RepID=A0A6M1T3F4_9BACT|nr:beta-N-acetylhexosaminidase [Halalkalibaculum roseum]NGP77267.1 beta-N-acetylhexosaminidase [Halalkalibaculum roseum]
MSTEKNIIPLLVLFILVIATACTQTTEETVAIIPEPVSVSLSDGNFTLTPSTSIVISENTPELRHVADYLSNKLYTANWFYKDVSTELSPSDTSIVLSLEPDASPDHDEGYALSVTPEQVKITARTAHGLFYGVQSLLQLLPAEINYQDPSFIPANFEWTIPAVEINDYPRYEYRGMHLDVARHFFPVDFLKKYIDLLAMHKMNRFHWHLTEDQGWRLEIKQYPRLTEVGGWRDSTLVGKAGSGRYDGIRYGGYYTQEEAREIVQYAADRFITVIPEIEMPGHSSAALEAYPELGCEPEKDYKAQTTWGVFEDIYCPSEETFTFLENVLTEVIDLFPSEYIHIGGDEAPKTAWENSDMAQQVIEREGLEDEHELQSYFIRRIEQFLNSKGRQIIGWDEILEGGLAPNATVMSWRGIEGGIAAAQQGHDVVMTPTSHVYLDYYQADPETEPLAIGGFTTLEKTYSYEPTPDTLTEEESKHILGAQGNVWTEYMHTGRKVEYMAYPRAAALSEVVWSPAEKRDWTNFWGRLQTHFQRLEYLDINAAGHYRGQMPELRNE